MSRENMEVVRRWYELISSNPADLPAAITEMWDADCDYYPVRKWPEAHPCHGRSELSQFLTRIPDAFSRVEFAIQDLIAVGDDRVLARANMRFEGRGSGMSLAGDVHFCVWMRHGRIFRVEDHLTPSGALHALGLEGETLEAAGLRG
jgi:ketosteroid isomerase-like protein